VIEGLENAPEALHRMLEGRNFAKLLVRVGPVACRRHFGEARVP
jgi:hypothetical protein